MITNLGKSIRTLIVYFVTPLILCLSPCLCYPVEQIQWVISGHPPHSYNDAQTACANSRSFSVALNSPITNRVAETILPNINGFIRCLGTVIADGIVYNNEVTDYAFISYITRPDVTLSKILGSQPPLTCNPISISTGNKYLAQTDYITSNNYPLLIQRSYNSLQFEDRGIGINWQHNWLGYTIVTATDTQMYVKRPDGKTYMFSLINNVWQGDADVTDKLERLTDAGGTLTGWRYTKLDGAVEAYNAKGKLLSITSRAGFTQTLGFDGGNRVVTISDAFGRILHFSYDAYSRIASMTNPAGGTYTSNSISWLWLG